MEMQWEDIDDRFFNSDTNDCFRECLVCEKDLLVGDEDYFIERMFRRVPKLNIVEPIFEYAMCGRCAEDLRNELSTESLQRIEQYFATQIRKQSIPNIEDRTNICLLTGKPIEDALEFSYHAHCRGKKQAISLFPYAISDQAMEAIVHLLSKETTDTLDGFQDTYFMGPPEFADLLRPRWVPL